MLEFFGPDKIKNKAEEEKNIEGLIDQLHECAFDSEIRTDAGGSKLQILGWYEPDGRQALRAMARIVFSEKGEVQVERSSFKMAGKDKMLTAEQYQRLLTIWGHRD